MVALAAAMALRKALLRRKLLADEAGLLEFLFVGIFDGLFVAVACLAPFCGIRRCWSTAVLAALDQNRG